MQQLQLFPLCIAPAPAYRLTVYDAEPELFDLECGCGIKTTQLRRYWFASEPRSAPTHLLVRCPACATEHRISLACWDDVPSAPSRSAEAAPPTRRRAR
jgi:hypothetical protein